MRAREPSPDRPVGHDGKSPVPLTAEVFSDEQIETYLASVRSGAGLDLAARAVESTGTVMRRLRRRDPVFAARVREAQDEALAQYRDRLRAEARRRATTEGGSDRLLEVELATHVPGYEHLRRDRVKVDARMEHAIVLPPLDDMPDEKLEALRALLLEFGGEVIDGEVVDD